MRFGSLRRLIAVTVVLLSCLLAGLTLPGSAAATTVQDEAAFARDINALRASKGLQPLTVDSRLGVTARRFAGVMASAGRIYHNPDLAAQAPGDWLKLGENVGVGYDEAGLHQAFVNSPGHYRNLVDADFTSVGIGVVYSGGRTWVVEMFMKSASPPVVEHPVKPTLVTSENERAARYRAVIEHHG